MAGDIISLPANALADGLSEQRRSAIQDLLKELKQYRRRAKSPTASIALAELEHEVEQIQKRWTEAGLINGQQELSLAAEAPAQRKC